MNRQGRLLWLTSLILAATVLWTTQNGYAAGRTSTRKTGVIVAVEDAKHRFVIRPDGETEEVVIEWQTRSGFFVGGKTEFFEGENPTAATILKKGIRVQVRYHEALFTPNRASLVRWLKPSGRDKP